MTLLHTNRYMYMYAYAQRHLTPLLVLPISSMHSPAILAKSMHGPRTSYKLQVSHRCTPYYVTTRTSQFSSKKMPNTVYVPFRDPRSVSPGSCSSINRDICIFLCWSTTSHFALLLLCGDSQRTNLRLSQELVVGLRYGVAACRW